MSSLNTAGLLLIAGFVLILVASFAGPPGLYQEPDSAARLDIIADHATRWWVSNLTFSLAGLITAVGLVLASLQMPDRVSVWLVGSAAVTYLLGTLFWVFFMYRRTVDPASLFTSYAFSPVTVALLALLVLGLLLFGIAFLQAGLPRWLGIVTIGGMVLIGGAAALVPGPFFESFPPQTLYLFTLAAGIVFLRQ